MAKTRVSFLCDKQLVKQFQELAEARGHTMTWYLTGCIREIVDRAGGSEEGEKKPRRKYRQMKLPKVASGGKAE